MAFKSSQLCVTGLHLVALLLSPLAAVCAVQPPVKPPPQPAARTTLFKQIPGDTGVWRREPFRSVPDSKKPSAVHDNAKFAALPGMPPKAGIDTTPDLVLQGIMKSGEHYYAIINGRTVKAGDHIGSSTITRIDRYRATIKDSTGIHILDIYQGRINRGTP